MNLPNSPRWFSGVLPFGIFCFYNDSSERRRSPRNEPDDRSYTAAPILSQKMTLDLSTFESVWEKEGVR